MNEAGSMGMPGGLPPAARMADLEALAEGARRAQPQEAAEMFEELLASLLVKELRRAVPEGLFGDGPGADVYEGWFDRHLGKSLAKSWDLDVAGLVRAGLEQKARAQGAAGTTENR